MRACQACGRPFTPRRPGHVHCAAHEPRGDAARSPTTRGRDASYWRNRARLLADRPPCHWCGAPATTADHLVPVARGGTHDPANLVPACKPCNSSRRADPRWTGRSAT
jgi:hypothetical protein